MEIKFKLKIKDVELELDKKDLLELRSTLLEMFPQQKEVVYRDRYSWPYTWQYSPIWTSTSGNVTLCASNGTSSTSTLASLLNSK